MKQFYGRILILGYGKVGEGLISLIFKHIDIDAKQIIIVDSIDKKLALRQWISQGIQFCQKQILLHNYQNELSQYLKEGDVLIDLSSRTGTLDIAKWCHSKDVMYLNSSLERWSEIESLYFYPDQVSLKKIIKEIDYKGATAVFQHGANPGIVSHLTKLGLLDMANYSLKTLKKEDLRKKIETHLQDNNFPFLARDLGVKVVHITDLDTQCLNRVKQPNEFINTWSIPSFTEEAISYSEFSWGTHEKNVPSHLKYFSNEKWSQVYSMLRAIDCWSHSWTAKGPMKGMLVPHPETFTIAEELAVYKENTLQYRPTVCFVYRPCLLAIESLDELITRNNQLQEIQYVISSEQASGGEEVGVFLFGDQINWWTGSILSNDEVRRIIPSSNSSTLPVAGSLVAALEWMIENPRCGFNIPENLPFRETIETAKPYLGSLLSLPVNWSPNAQASLNDRCQFSSFHTQRNCSL